MKQICRAAVICLYLLMLTGLTAAAQDAYSLIGVVNALREANGLEAYSIDNDLMAKAQIQSEYQASLGYSTHERADGSGVPCLSENVCAGTGVNASYCVNNMWTDELHRYTMIGLSSGTAGAGLASVDGKNYYTLMINSAGEETGLATLNGPGSAVSANSDAASGLVDVDAYPVQPGQFATSTAELDGSVYHVVQSNETLWSIAINYGRTVADIQALNGLEGNDVAAGRRLLIVYGGTQVADTATPTQTLPPATNTPKPTSTKTATLPPLDTLTPTITMTATPEPLIGHISFFDTPQARPFGLTLTIICAIGLLMTLYFGFLRKK